MPTELVFSGFQFNAVEREGQVWLTLSEVAQVLYGKGEAQSDTPFDHRLKKLYRRHADEFSDGMTALVKMHTAGGMQEVRVFTLRGAHLLGMFARSKVAKEFRRWALDRIDEHIREKQGCVPKFHAALLEYSGKKAVASLCGRNLQRWRGEKLKYEHHLQQLAEQIQPGLFVH